MRGGKLTWFIKENSNVILVRGFPNVFQVL